MMQCIVNDILRNIDDDSKIFILESLLYLDWRLCPELNAVDLNRVSELPIQ